MNTILWTIATFLASPVLLTASALKPKTRNHFLVFAPGKLGDLVAMTPLFRAIKQSYPSATLTVLCHATSSPALMGNPFIDTLETLDTRTNRGALLSRLCARRIDTVINAGANSFGSTLGVWLMCPTRINTVTDVHGTLIRLLGILQTRNIRYGLHLSTFRHYMALAESVGATPVPYQLDFAVRDEAVSKANAWMKQKNLAPGSFVILNVTAGNYVKEWPPEKFAELAHRIIDELGLRVIVSTAERATADNILRLIDRPDAVTDSCGFTLEELGALCGHAAVHVSVDTGPLYIAYACGAPVVILIGPIDPAEQIPPESARCIHVPPPPGTVPWVFIARTPRTGTPEQLRASRDTSVDAVFDAVKRITAAQSRPLS